MADQWIEINYSRIPGSDLCVCSLCKAVIQWDDAVGHTEWHGTVPRVSHPEGNRDR
jgi:hypothetical protein